MKKTILLMCCAWLATSLGYAQTDKRLKGIDKELEEVLSATKAAGFAVAVVEGDKVLYSRGFGYRDYEKKIPTDANTLFAIGSSTKAFTAAVLGQLRDEEKLSFEDSPLKYIPEFKFYNNEMNNQIMLKDLMSHRTGLGRHDFAWYLFPSASKDSLLMRVKHHEPFAGVRKEWYYNNFMFLAQGVIAERITGKSWEENISERFFEPLEMTNSNLSIDGLKNSENAAFGYKLSKEETIEKVDYYDISGMSPAGSINSSANEMANWLKLWLNEGKFKGKKILSPAYISEAMSSQMIVSAGLPDEKHTDMHLSNYGYGWFISSYRGYYRVEHGGNIDGFSANVAFFPSDKIGIIVLANQDGSAVPWLVRNILSDRLLGVQKTNWTKEFADGQEKSKKALLEVKKNSTEGKIKNTKPSHILQEYTGKYAHPGYGAFRIELKNDSLFAVLPLQRLYLKHYHYDVFEPFEVAKQGVDTTESGGLKFNFVGNDAGEISTLKMKIEPTLPPIEFEHTPNTIKVEKEALEKYVGEYELAGTIIKAYIKNENVLYVFVPGQPEYELVPTEKHKFSFKVLEGFKVAFVEAADGAISEVLFIQPNGTFKATRKK